ncbi:MAG: sugar MFS transporter [Cytophagales bacterium]|nr:sugar MFS transporter [Cytophaga sp.]
MAGGAPNHHSTVHASSDANANYTVPIALMATLFFLIGFITVLNDVLIPIMKNIFNFSEKETWKVMLIQFSFFMAYGLLSIPGGWLVKAIGYKKGTIYSLFIVAFGLLMFYPASEYTSYGLFLFALFCFGSGLAILQVAINPYLIALGTPETGASRLNLGGAFNSTATFLGPILGAYVLLNECIVSQEHRLDTVRSFYVVIGLLTIALAISMFFIKLPKLSIENDKDEHLDGSIFQFRHLLFGSGAIFFYVGAEVVVGSLLILYLKSDTMGNIPEKFAASLVAYFWAGAMIGRFWGSSLTKHIPTNKALAFVAAFAFVLIFLSMTDFMINHHLTVPVVNMGEHCETKEFYFGFKLLSVPFAAICLLLIGLANSIMWPSIFPLGIARLGKYTSRGSGLMVTMVSGGALVSLLQAKIASEIGYRYSFALCLICYGYILFFALKGYKPVKAADNAEDEIRNA